MPNHVVNSAILKCSMGLAPGTLVVLPKNMMMVGNQPAANIMDHVPMANIMPFGMCRSPANPTVAAATAAAMGVLTPMPCIPNTPTPWTPGCATMILGHMPALTTTCKCMCAWEGVIEVVIPGQRTTVIP